MVAIGKWKDQEDHSLFNLGEATRSISAVKGYKNSIPISVDEWGALGRSFQSVLAVAQSLNLFIRHADVVKMGNFTMMTSLLSSDPQAIDPFVACDSFSVGKYWGIPYRM